MIHGSTTWLNLLAAWRTNWVDKFDGVYWDSNTDEVWWIFVVTAVLLVGALVWHVTASWARGRFPTNSLRALFRELCRAHQLDHCDRRLLKSLAVARGVRGPALLFVQPELFRIADVPAELSAQAEQLTRLADRIFDEGAARDG